MTMLLFFLVLFSLSFVCAAIVVPSNSSIDTEFYIAHLPLQWSGETIICERQFCYIYCFGTRSCELTTIQLNDPNNNYIELHCLDWLACGNVTMLPVPGKEIVVHCQNSGSCKYMEIDAIHEDGSLSVTCAESSACQFAVFGCPWGAVGACAITCLNYDYACAGVTISTNDAFVSNYLDLRCPSFNGIACVAIVLECTGIRPDSQIGWDPNVGEYNCTSYTCCPWSEGNRECNVFGQCEIDCSTSHCVGQIINGSHANSLTVDCTVDAACDSATIICPTGYGTGSGSECHIRTEQAWHGLYETQVYATNTEMVNISCTGGYTCDLSDFYLSGVNTVHITCHSYGSNACDECNFHANTSVNVNLVAIDDRAFSSSYLFAGDANNLAIVCVDDDSSSSYSACYESYFDVPSSPNGGYVTIECYGEGCSTPSYIHTLNDGVNIDWTINGCGFCDDADACVGGWQVQCDFPVTQYSDWTGSSCSDNVCNCNEMTASYDNTPSDDYCLNADSVGSGGGNADGSGSLGASLQWKVTDTLAVAGLAAGVLICAIVVCVFCCCRKQRKEAQIMAAMQKSATIDVISHFGGPLENQPNITYNAKTKEFIIHHHMVGAGGGALNHIRYAQQPPPPQQPPPSQQQQQVIHVLPQQQQQQRPVIRYVSPPDNSDNMSMQAGNIVYIQPSQL